VSRRVSTEQVTLVAFGVLFGVFVTLGIAALIQAGRIHSREVERQRREWAIDDEEDEA
jgi:hypothetical protein